MSLMEMPVWMLIGGTVGDSTQPFKERECLALPLAQPEGWRSVRWCHVTAAVSGSECHRGLLCCWVGRAAWAGEALLATDAPWYLDLGTHHLLSIPGGLRWWPQCQKGVLPPGGHLSREAHSSSSAWELSSSVPRDVTTPVLPDHLFPSPSSGSTDGCDRPGLSPDTHKCPCHAFFMHSGGSERQGGPREFLTHVVWRHKGGTWIALYTNVQ